jgi:hypothetical protein
VKRILPFAAAILGCCSVASIGAEPQTKDFEFSTPAVGEKVVIAPEQDSVAIAVSGKWPNRAALSRPVRMVVRDQFGNVYRQDTKIVFEPDGTWRAPQINVIRDLESIELIELAAEGAREFDAWSSGPRKASRLDKLRGYRRLAWHTLTVAYPTPR